LNYKSSTVSLRVTGNDVDGVVALVAELVGLVVEVPNAGVVVESSFVVLTDGIV